MKKNRKTYFFKVVPNRKFLNYCSRGVFKDSVTKNFRSILKQTSSRLPE